MKYYLFISCLMISFYLFDGSQTTLSQGTDQWVQVMGNGFGDVNNKGVSAFYIFKGQLYAATNRVDNSSGTLVPGPGTAQLWRTSDGQNWSRVTSFSPSLQTQGIFFMAESGQTTPQYFYLAADGGGYPAIYRSTDGANWTWINGPGSDFDTTNIVSPAGLAMKETGGTWYLYTGTNNSKGAQIWRVRFDTLASWEKVLDFASIDSTTTVTTYLYVWQNTLSAGTFSGGPNRTGAHIYQSSTGNPGTWVKNSGVGNGFGSLNNVNIAGIIEFNSQLYASTQNRASGGELWRTSDGQVWNRVIANGFGNPRNEELHRITAAQGQLWVTTFGPAPTPTQVWRSSDGLNFVQSNPDGFQDSSTTSGFPVIIDFQNSVYWGGQNTKTGGQIWRTDMPTVPILASPSDGATGLSTSPTLSWQPSAGATSYRVQVSTSSAFATTVVNDSTIVSTSEQVQLQPNTTYFWRVNAKNAGGTSGFSEVRRFTTLAPTSVEQISNELPTEYNLSQNYPNPFNPVTTIEFSLPKSSYVTLTIFNTLGIQIQTLADHTLAPCKYRVRWDAKDLPSGVYFYRLVAGSFTESRKLVLLR